MNERRHCPSCGTLHDFELHDGEKALGVCPLLECAQPGMVRDVPDGFVGEAIRWRVDKRWIARL